LPGSFYISARSDAMIFGWPMNRDREYAGDAERQRAYQQRKARAEKRQRLRDAPGVRPFCGRDS